MTMILFLQAHVFFEAGEERKAEKIYLQLTEKTPFVNRGFLALGKCMKVKRDLKRQFTY